MFFLHKIISFALKKKKKEKKGKFSVEILAPSRDDGPCSIKSILYKPHFLLAPPNPIDSLHTQPVLSDIIMEK